MGPAVAWVYGLIGLATPGYEPFVGLLAALHAVSRTQPRPVALGALAGCAVPFGINAYNAAEASADVGGTFAGSAAFWVAISVTVWGLGRLAYAAERRAEERRLLEAAQAVRDERIRVARDLHDVVSHSVNAMLLQAAGARRQHTEADPALLSALEAIEHTGVGAMTELHQMLGLLREAGSAPDPAPAAGAPERDVAGLAPGLGRVEELAFAAQASGLTVDLTMHGAPRDLDPAVDVTAYRLVQEGLTNAMKYAGVGAHVDVELTWSSDQVEIRVHDQRDQDPAEHVPAPTGAGLGLQGLTERVHDAGGDLRARALEDGFDLVAHLPTAPTSFAAATPAATRAAASSSPGPVSS